MKDINGIPVYELTIDMLNDELGVSVISLVESPAVEKEFIALSSQKQIKLSINEDKRIVTGVALRADFPIYRKDPKTGKEYFFTISPDQIKLIMQKFMLEKRIDLVNVEHDSDTSLDDVFLWESYQLTDKHKVGYPEFKDIEPGSWMVSYQVNNDRAWEAVKEGKLKGFSAELMGTLNESQQESTLSTHEIKLATDLLTII